MLKLLPKTGIGILIQLARMGCGVVCKEALPKLKVQAAKQTKKLKKKPKKKLKKQLKKLKEKPKEKPKEPSEVLLKTSF